MMLIRDFHISKEQRSSFVNNKFFTMCKNNLLHQKLFNIDHLYNSRWLYSGLLHHAVWWMITDISEVLLPLPSGQRALTALIREAASNCEMSVTQKTHLSENVKSYICDFLLNNSYRCYIISTFGW